MLANIFYSFAILPEIIRYAGWSIFVGILIAVCFVGILLFLIRGFYPKYVFSAGSIVVSVILGLLLSFQLVPVCASIALKNKVDDFEMWLNENVIHPEDYPVPEEISLEESHEIMEEAIENYPLLGTLIGSGEFVGFDTSNVTEAIGNALNEFLDSFILKMLLVALVETLVCAFIIIKVQDRKISARMRGRMAVRSRRDVRPAVRVRRR